MPVCGRCTVSIYCDSKASDQYLIYSRKSGAVGIMKDYLCYWLMAWIPCRTSKRSFVGYLCFKTTNKNDFKTIIQFPLRKRLTGEHRGWCRTVSSLLPAINEEEDWLFSNPLKSSGEERMLLKVDKNIMENCLGNKKKTTLKVFKGFTSYITVPSGTKAMEPCE